MYCATIYISFVFIFTLEVSVSVITRGIFLSGGTEVNLYYLFAFYVNTPTEVPSREGAVRKWRRQVFLL